MPFTKPALFVCLFAVPFLSGRNCIAQQTTAVDQTDNGAPLTARERMLLDRIDKLDQRIAALEEKSSTGTAASQQPSIPSAPAAVTAASRPPAGTAVTTAGSNDAALSFPDGTTLNFNLDGYYGYNFNHPAGRVNLLRFNDPTSDNFTLNQATVMIERVPDLTVGRRFGYRLDLMYGQNTDSLQGSGANEPRPWIYRNVFQAYGSYILPVGSGLQMDFGKFASSFGYEGTYVKDQLNYSRSLWYTFLPAYHMGLRASYNLNSKVSAQYWLVNGLNQTEGFNGFKSQAAILIVKPNSNVT